MKVGKNRFVQYLLAVVFVTSGITKLLFIDDFQVFIYSLNILNLNLSMILTGVLIGVELSIGLLFLAGIYPKIVSYATLGLMVAFTIFILYLETSGSTQDCHCFGNIVKFSNTATILKNIVIILMVVYSLLHSKQKKTKYNMPILLCCLLVGFGATIIVRPPDLFFTKEIHTSNYYFKPSLDKFIANNKLTKQKRLICFLSPKCKYCQLTAKRISIISGKTKNTHDILYVFWKTDNDTVDFFKETQTRRFDSQDMNVIEFLKLTNGTMPLTILYNNGAIEKAFRYKDFDEAEVIRFLKE
ncbi:MAG TPA: DoxX family protein [Paludibacter sp.]|nr:DoxX family protein [Paludibacter sp.]